MLWRGFLIAQRVEQRGPRSERLHRRSPGLSAVSGSNRHFGM